MHTTCPQCKTAVIEALAEPDGKLRYFRATPSALWRLVKIGDHAAAVETQVHELHRCNQNDVDLTKAPA